MPHRTTEKRKAVDANPQIICRGTMTSIVPWRFAQCGTIEKSIAYLGQYRIILSADTASEVRQLLSQKRR